MCTTETRHVTRINSQTASQLLLDPSKKWRQIKVCERKLYNL